MSALAEKGLEIAATMVDEKTVSQLKQSITSDRFGAGLGRFALEFVFAKLWSRPGLTARERSMVTLSLLIAQRQTGEIRIHTLAALRNGCTVAEIEEIVYQSSAYAGFPCASAAMATIYEVLREKNHIT